MPDEIMHAMGLNAPPTFPSLHDTVPVGIVGELDVSAIFTVNETGAP